MLNPVKEAIYSATYVDNYIDSVENLPDDVQRHLSRIRDIDVQYRNLLRDVDHYYDLWCTLKSSNDASSNRRSRAITRMQQTLIQAQELGDEKMKIVNQLQELIDQKTRQLDTDQKNLDIKEELQQQLQNQYRSEQMMDECGGGGVNAQKRSRTQSPARDAVSGANNPGSSNVGTCYDRGVANVKDAYGNFTSGNIAQDQSGTERSISTSSGIMSSSSGNGVNVSSINNAEQMRTAGGKRARRRNDTLNMSMDHMGNDSNSANETGGNVAERNLVQGRASNINTGVNQKKNMNQTQAALASVGGSASGQVNMSNSSGKKKKRKTRGNHTASAQITVREETPPPETIDPDEPTYCVCNQISFGEMILCDNDLCPIEWFHFSCVSLVLKPKGKWYCPNCRGDRPNVMKPKAQFLKELERYNKEKEEKT